MKNLIKLFLLIVLVTNIISVYANGPRGKSFGFGLVLGDPVGLTAKLWTSNENAFDFYLGNSYFGNLRLGADYLWHFDAFNSSVVKMYAGPGIAVGFGRGEGIWYKQGKNKFYYWDDGETGIAARVIFGLNIIPRRTPLEIFLEAGPLIGIVPNMGVNMDAAVGIRFYP